MSSGDVSRFLDTVAGDPALCENLLSRGHTRAGRIAALIEVGYQRGFEFTVQDVAGLPQQRSRAQGPVDQARANAGSDAPSHSRSQRILAWLAGGDAPARRQPTSEIEA